MIAFVEGVLVESGPPAVVAVGDGACGLTVHLTTRAAERLPAAGQRVRLWTHLIVREDGWSLYGFPRREERAFFQLLLGVSGVGPRVALGLLSNATPAELAGYLRAGDEKALARLPGLGRKTAARLIVELGQRLPEGLAATHAEAGGAPRSGDAAPDEDLRAAAAVLGALGLPAPRAEQALRAARARSPEVAANLERWVREALRSL